jgi:hypothetical protein
MLKENLRAANKEVPEFTSNPIQIQLMQGVLEENDDMRLAHSSLSTTLPPSRAFPPLPSSLEALLVFHGSSAASSMKTRLPAVAQFPGTHRYVKVTIVHSTFKLKLTLNLNTATEIRTSTQRLPSPTKQPSKRRRDQRKRATVRACRRCRETTCPGNNDITKCLTVCMVPCKKCGHTEGCRGVDNGRHRTYL